jgi:predicted Zn-dependent peptidase
MTRIISKRTRATAAAETPLKTQPILVTSVLRWALAALLASVTFNAPPIWVETADAQDLTTKRPAIAARPVRLDWRNIQWSPLIFDRFGLKSGGALTVYPSIGNQKFQLDLVFTTGVYVQSESERPELGAYVDLLLQGGTRSQTFEQIQRVLAANGLQLQTSLTSAGHVRMSTGGLLEDFDRALGLVSELLQEPAFRPEAFETWKREQKATFEGRLDASSLREQYQILEPLLVSLVLGPEHYFATYLQRNNPSRIAKISRDSVTALHKRVINSANLTALLSGGVSDQQIEKTRELLEKLPASTPAVPKWLPGRRTQPAQEKADVLIVQKPDMPQSSIYGRVSLASAGELNPQEEVQLGILREVFSSSTGVVGEDRFSAAMRKDSGLSYSPYSYVDPGFIYPNTNVAGWTFVFQTPVDKTAEGLDLAYKTWETFRSKGISAEEFESTRIILMNQMLATERTHFERAERLLADILKDRIPTTTPEETALQMLEGMNSHVEVNELLQRLTAKGTMRLAYTIMGGVDDKQITALRKMPFVQKVTVLPFDKVIADLNK